MTEDFFKTLLQDSIVNISYKEVIIDKLMLYLTPTQIEEWTGINKNTVKTIYYRFLEKMDNSKFGYDSHIGLTTSTVFDEEFNKILDTLKLMKEHNMLKHPKTKREDWTGINPDKRKKRKFMLP